MAWAGNLNVSKCRGGLVLRWLAHAATSILLSVLARLKLAPLTLGLCLAIYKVGDDNTYPALVRHLKNWGGPIKFYSFFAV